MRRLAGVSGWAVAALVVTLSAAGIVAAQDGDPELQGRVLQRRDGFLFVYKDGHRFWVRPASLTDQQINQIPEAGPSLDRLDQFFGSDPPPQDVEALADTFDDPAVGKLPRSSQSPTLFTLAYVEGEYSIRKIDPNW